MLTPYQIEKTEKMKTSTIFLSWEQRRKERKKEGKNISKQIVWEGGALRSAASVYFLPLPKYS
jgi:hypothetical protein